MRDESEYFRFWMSFDLLLDPRVNDEGEMRACCPFHNDNAPSMSLNVNTGLWVCFSCKDEYQPDRPLGGNAIEFVKRWSRVHDHKDMTIDQAHEEVRRRSGLTVLPDEATIAAWAGSLDQAPTVKAYLNRRGIYNETLLRRYEVGWDGEFITLPVRDLDGSLKNVRRLPPEEKKSKFSIKGYGSPRLWPADQLTADERPLLLCEGEIDCITALVQGHRSITSTGGAQFWRDDWNELFRGQDVIICYDGDKAGREGSQRVINNLQPIARSIRSLVLPDGEDVNSLWQKGKALKDYLDVANLVELQKPRLLLGSELLRVAEEEMRKPYIVDGVLKHGWLGVLGGHAKAGKTTLATHMMIATTVGQQWAGRQCQQLPTAYISYEMALGDLVSMLQDVNADPQTWPAVLDNPPRPLDPVWLFGFLQESYPHTPGLCVVDSAVAAFALRGEDENSSGEVGYFLRNLAAGCRQTGWTVLVIHHLRKSASGDMLDFAGSREWVAAPDVLMKWTATSFKEPGQLMVSGRVPQIDPEALQLTRSSCVRLGSVQDVARKTLARDVLYAIQDLGPLAPKDIAKELMRPETEIRQILRDFPEYFERGGAANGQPKWSIREGAHCAG